MGDILERVAVRVRVSENCKMPRQAFRVGGRNIDALESSLAIKTSDPTVDHVDIAKAKKRERGNILFVDEAEGRFQVTQRVRIDWVELEP